MEWGYFNIFFLVVDGHTTVIMNAIDCHSKWAPHIQTSHMTKVTDLNNRIDFSIRVKFRNFIPFHYTQNLRMHLPHIKAHIGMRHDVINRTEVTSIAMVTMLDVFFVHSFLLWLTRQTECLSLYT